MDVSINNPELSLALDSISAESILEHIKTLASDEFEGRLPGSAGEELTTDYLVKTCRELGFQPCDPGGEYFQQVPAIGMKAQPSLTFRADGDALDLKFPDQYVVMSYCHKPEVAIDDAEVVFVGYGIIAPEYDWNDFKNIDVRGKVIVLLVGDPRRSDADDPSQLDQSFFRGNAMTYYGRWTYKYEIAAQLGAAGALIVHDSEMAGYSFDVVKNSWSGENFDLDIEDENALDVAGWISTETAGKLFAQSGLNFKQVKEAAQHTDFKPVSLKSKATVRIVNTIRRFVSKNVIAVLPGSDPILKKECIIYSAHWDHFGRTADGVFSGAIDNGSGVACVLETAKAISKLQQAPRRSIVLFFSTLEESGLLGARYYVDHPYFSLQNTVAIINLDVMNVWGRTKKVVSIAQGHSSLDETLEECAQQQNRSITSDPEPEKGCFYRSDHVEFLRRGVPAIFFLHPGADYIGQSADFGEMKRLDYLQNAYHKVHDKVKADWDLSGTVEDVQLIFLAGLKIGQAANRPQWKASSEFKDAGKTLAR